MRSSNLAYCHTTVQLTNHCVKLCVLDWLFRCRKETNIFYLTQPIQELIQSSNLHVHSPCIFYKCLTVDLSLLQGFLGKSWNLTFGVTPVTKMLSGSPQLPLQITRITNHKLLTYQVNSRTSELSEPAEDELSRQIRAFVTVKEDNLKTMPDRSVSSRRSAGWKILVLSLQTLKKWNIQTSNWNFLFL